MRGARFWPSRPIPAPWWRRVLTLLSNHVEGHLVDPHLPVSECGEAEFQKLRVFVHSAAELKERPAGHPGIQVRLQELLLTKTGAAVQTIGLQKDLCVISGS